ncbi:uncharacterized protein [Henckelia pumila]|uniref:uncharacterized protein n=1 Tax=Henckelia pumila TaxID=405737 RepID=UPI003C6E21F5
MANQNGDHPNLEELVAQAVPRALVERGEENPFNLEHNAHLDEIKKLKEEMEQLRKKQAGYLATTTRSIPFTQEILDVNLPKKFKLPHVAEYDGKGDPEDHLACFENAALLHKYSDQIKCRAFLTTLIGPAQKWFNMLCPGEIKEFKDFSKSFLHHFASSKKHPTTTFSLFAIKQQEHENLRAYIRRFSALALEVSRAAVKRERPKSPKNNRVPSNNSGMGQPFRPALLRAFTSFTPLRMSKVRALQICDDRKLTQKPPWTEKGPRNRRQRGRSRQRAKTAPPQEDFNRQNQDQLRDDRAHQRPAPPARGIINMISGGPTDGDSNRARKTSSQKLINMEIDSQTVNTGPTLYFGPEDLKGVANNHNDALVIRAMVANYDVARIFVDSCSSVNVLFQEVINQMDLG